jgi:hypothetical protein
MRPPTLHVPRRHVKTPSWLVVAVVAEVVECESGGTKMQAKTNRKTQTPSNVSPSTTVAEDAPCIQNTN